ncbi:Cysteine-rich protein 1 [Porites harrisoni]
MPKCPTCAKEVYFAERVSSIGKDWHRGCLKCAKCKKTLSPGGHSEVKRKNRLEIGTIPCVLSAENVVGNWQSAATRNEKASPTVITLAMHLSSVREDLVMEEQNHTSIRALL